MVQCWAGWPSSTFSKMLCPAEPGRPALPSLPEKQAAIMIQLNNSPLSLPGKDLDTQHFSLLCRDEPTTTSGSGRGLQEVGSMEAKKTILYRGAGPSWRPPPRLCLSRILGEVRLSSEDN